MTCPNCKVELTDENSPHNMTKCSAGEKGEGEETLYAGCQCPWHPQPTQSQMEQEFRKTLNSGRKMYELGKQEARTALIKEVEEISEDLIRARTLSQEDLDRGIMALKHPEIVEYLEKEKGNRIALYNRIQERLTKLNDPTPTTS